MGKSSFIRTQRLQLFGIGPDATLFSTRGKHFGSHYGPKSNNSVPGNPLARERQETGDQIDAAIGNYRPTAAEFPSLNLSLVILVEKSSPIDRDRPSAAGHQGRLWSIKRRLGASTIVGC